MKRQFRGLRSIQSTALQHCVQSGLHKREQAGPPRWHSRTSRRGRLCAPQSRVESTSLRISAPKDYSIFYSFSSQYLSAPEPSRYPAEMTTTTTFQGMDPGAKSSSRVLRPPGGETSLSFGSDENTTPRKNKMVSNIFAEPDDPHANRRTEPPTGPATGTLCGEPSAPLRRCQQPILFPKNPQPELTTIHNSGAAMVWRQRQEENGQVNDNPDEVEAEQDEQEQPNQQKETPQPSAPSGGAGGKRNPPGGKSSLILG